MRLAFEGSAERSSVAEELLDRHHPIRTQVGGAIDGAHAARCDALDQAVALAKQRSGSKHGWVSRDCQPIERLSTCRARGFTTPIGRATFLAGVPTSDFVVGVFCSKSFRKESR